MNRRELKLNEYGISSKRFKELSAFCEQYPEWVEELKKRSPAVCTDAGRRSELENKCRIIETAALEADEELGNFIIKSVCYEKPFWYLRDILEIPCSQSAFYDRRRYFFYLLHKRKRM